MMIAARHLIVATLAAVLGATAIPVAADDAVDHAAADNPARAEHKPARLIEFTGDREFLKTSSRLRVWRSEVGYILGVDAGGTPTSCALTEEFRMNYVNDKLCEVLVKHHSFEPAQDASGAAIAGQYAGLLNFVEMREKE